MTEVKFDSSPRIRPPSLSKRMLVTPAIIRSSASQAEKVLFEVEYVVASSGPS